VYELHVQEAYEYVWQEYHACVPRIRMKYMAIDEIPKNI